MAKVQHKSNKNAWSINQILNSLFFYELFYNVINILAKKYLKNTRWFNDKEQNWVHDNFLGTTNLIKIK
jgi:hypothetical protein